jgi:hypothetical protein
LLVEGRLGATVAEPFDVPDGRMVVEAGGVKVGAGESNVLVGAGVTVVVGTPITAEAVPQVLHPLLVAGANELTPVVEQQLGEATRR